MAEVLIDGYNLIRQTDGLANQERRQGLAAGREALIHRLAAYCRATGDAVTVVFDGDDGFDDLPRARKQMGVNVVFSRPPKTADDVMISRVQRSHGKKALRVVSSDRAIVRVAKQHKITSVSSDSFAREMAQCMVRGPKQQVEDGAMVGLDEADVAYWASVFETEKRLFEDSDEDF